MIINKGITTGVMSCHNCSTIEGESELSISRNVEQYQHHILPLYAGAMTQDLTVDQYSTWMDQCSTTHIGARGPTVTIKTPSRMQFQIAYIIFAQ